MSRYISDLCDEAEEKAKAFLVRLEAEGVHYELLETRRNLAVQTAYYAQGREVYDRVLVLRAAAGLPVISEEEAARKITWTMRSKHLDGKALDICVLTESGKRDWTYGKKRFGLWSWNPSWLATGEIGESCGFTWGGRWDPMDPPHFEVVA